MNETNAIITVRRGTPNVPPLSLNMHSIYLTEQRLQETRAVTPASAPELRAAFNEACNTVTKYIAWIKYEILTAKKNLDLSRAEILLDKVPEVLKEKGIKDNADIREAIVNRDQDYQEKLDVLNTLEATKSLLESKSKTFERAYWDCRDIANDKGRIAASPNFSVNGDVVAYQEGNFIGKSKI
jgi:hypothetical protein